MGRAPTTLQMMLGWMGECKDRAKVPSNPKKGVGAALCTKSLRGLPCAPQKLGMGSALVSGFGVSRFFLERVALPVPHRLVRGVLLAGLCLLNAPHHLL